MNNKKGGYVRIINNMKPTELWGRRGFRISSLILIASLALMLFSIIYGHMHWGDYNNELIKWDDHALAYCGGFIFGFVFLLSIVGCWISSIFVRLDKNFTPKKNKKMELKLEKYSYKYAKKQNKKLKTNENKALKKNYKQKYKQEKK